MFFIHYRDAPEATGDEPEDADFETPKVYEAVSLNIFICLIEFIPTLGYLCKFVITLSCS